MIEQLNKKIQADNPEYVLIPNSAVEHEKCFSCSIIDKVILLKNKDVLLPAGDGPAIICKESGKVFRTGSTYSLERYIDSFNRTGDPYGDIRTYEAMGLYCTIEILGMNESFNSLEAIRVLKFYLKKGLKEVKLIIESVQSGKVESLRPDSFSQVEAIADELSNVGFKVKVV